MKLRLRTPARRIASFLAVTVMLGQPALAQRVYCYGPIKGPYVSTEGYCRLYEGVQITERQYRDKLADADEERREPRYCVDLSAGVRAFISKTSECPRGTHIITKGEYNQFQSIEERYR
jgi:hypothetical protein